MSEVVQLGWVERPMVQTEILAILQNEVGARSSQDMIERAALELSDRLWLIEQALFNNQRSEVEKLAISMVKMAKQIGLTELAQVALDLAHCCRHTNGTAIKAVSARLQRIGEASLHFAVQFPQTAR